jgi:hypothetical protein
MWRMGRRRFDVEEREDGDKEGRGMIFNVHYLYFIQLHA